MPNLSQFWFTFLILKIFIVFTISCSLASHTPENTVTLAIIVCDNEVEEMPSVNYTECGKVPLHICEKLMSFDRQHNQVVTMIKSVLITWVHSAKIPQGELNYLNQLDIIVFCNNQSIFDEISTEVAKWNPKYTHFLTLKFRKVEYTPEFQWMLQKYRPCSSYRAYFPEQLSRTDPDLKRVIYLDTDTLILRDIRHLWNLFDEFKEPMLIGALNTSWNYHRIRDVVNALSENKSIEFKHEKIVINPAVQLVNLENWKSDNWVRWMKQIQEELTLAKCPDKAGISTYLSLHNEQYFRLSTTWNYGTDCLWKHKRMDMHPACSSNEPGVSILHAYGGGYTFATNMKLTMEIFRQFNSVDLTSEISIKAFKNGLFRRFKDELKRCTKMIKDRNITSRYYYKNIGISSKKLLYYLRTLK